MKRSKFTDHRHFEGARLGMAAPLVLVRCRTGFPSSVCAASIVSDATVYKGKAKYGGMDVSEAKRLKGLEDENARLKRLLALRCSAMRR